MTTILITGAGRGIGFELAKQALSLGWDVIGAVRSQQAAYKLRADLQDVRVVVFDVTDAEAVAKAASQLNCPLDILINNAGVISPSKQSTLEMDFDGFAYALNVNTLGPLRISQAFLPHLKRGNNARVVTISSKMGSMSYANSDRIAYRASKAAVNKIVQGLATDLVGESVCAIAMHPGWVQTDMGGPSADIAVEESAAGILEVARNLTIRDTGRFINWDGSLADW